MKKQVNLILMIIGAVLLPTSLVAILFIINSVNPMQISFITSFKLENRLNEDIYITPIGVYNTRGDRCLLPLYITKVPALPSLKESDIKIKAGEVRLFFYDWDDVNASEIYIKTDKLHNVLIIDSKPNDGQFHPIIDNYIVIDNIANLHDTPPSITEVVNKRHSNKILIIILLCGAFAPIVFTYALLRYKEG
jgi:hypothetical protein